MRIMSHYGRVVFALQGGWGTPGYLLGTVVPIPSPETAVTGGLPDWTSVAGGGCFVLGGQEM